MGCFLILTREDYRQLSKSMKQGVRVLPPDGSTILTGHTRIEVTNTALRSAREMAELIRRVAPSARSTTVTAEEVDHAFRFTDHVSARHLADVVLATVGIPIIWPKKSIFSMLDSSSKGRVNYDLGNRGENTARTILEQGLGWTITATSIPSMPQGPDLVGYARGSSTRGDAIIAEVKTTTGDDSFEKQLKKGYGFRQCSDGWLKAAVDKANSRRPDGEKINIDPARTTVYGVLINVTKRTVSLYRRMDTDAVAWKSLKKDAPLSDYNIHI